MLVHSTSDFLSLCLGIVKTSGVFPFLPSSSLGIVDVHCLSRLGASGRRSACLLFAERVRSVYDRASKSASQLHSATSSSSPTHESKWLSSYCAFLNCASRCIHEIPYSPANTCKQRLINRAHSRTFDCSPVFSWAETFMNGAYRRRPNKRLFDGRIEKRLPTSVPIYIASLGEPRARERTLTENVSPHGARVISKRSWQSSEKALITPLTGGFPQVGRVIYCFPKTGDRFCLGVEFPDRTVKWDEHSSA